MKRRKYNDYHRITTDGLEEKQCRDCLEWFKMNNINFGVDNGNKDKFNHLCKECQKIYNHKTYMKDQEERIQKATQWKRNHPNRVKELEKKYRRRPETIKIKRISGKKRRDTGKHKAWTESNPEKVKQYTQNHRDHDILKLEWFSCQKAFDYRCAYCGKTLEEQLEQNHEQFHKEHKDHDGYNDIRNCVPACSNCNSIKRMRFIDELFESKIIGTFTQERLNKIIWWTTEGYKDFIIEKPPYRIKRKRREGLTTFFWQLWSVDEKRNMIEVLAIGDKKKDLDIHIKNYFGWMFFPSIELKEELYIVNK